MQLPYTTFNAGTRISQRAIDDIFRNARTIEQLKNVGDSIIHVKDMDDEHETILNITDEGIFAGYLEEVTK
jgi:hypothetical protein